MRPYLQTTLWTLLQEDTGFQGAETCWCDFVSSLLSLTSAIWTWYMTFVGAYVPGTLCGMQILCYWCGLQYLSSASESQPMFDWTHYTAAFLVFPCRGQCCCTTTSQQLHSPCLHPALWWGSAVCSCLQQALPWWHHMSTLQSTLPSCLLSWQMQTALHRSLPTLCRAMWMALFTSGKSLSGMLVGLCPAES